jgi:alpha-ketoglutarate-dependent 2,4-dichlorophenoxyacetate dioxygenase
MKLDPIANGFGVAVSGVDLKSADLDSLAGALEHALDKHQLLVFREADLDSEQYVRFGKALGTLEDFGRFDKIEGGHTIALSNLGQDGRIVPADDLMRRNMAADALWHTDHTYLPRRARYSFLQAEIVPEEGGGTDFCNTRAAYDALPQATKQRLEGLVALHSLLYSREVAGFTDWTEEQRAALPPIPQPLIFQNPRTGRKSLYIASHIGEIVGMPTAEARQLAGELIAFATQPQFVYSHRWRPGDIAVWDDRATMHRRAPYDDLNQMRKLHTMRVIEDSHLYDPEATYVIH